MMYENNAASTNGRFAYTLNNSQDNIDAKVREDGWTFIIPRGIPRQLNRRVRNCSDVFQGCAYKKLAKAAA